MAGIENLKVITTTFNLERESKNKLFGPLMKSIVEHLHKYNDKIIYLNGDFKTLKNSKFSQLENIIHKLGSLFKFINIYTDAIILLDDLVLKKNQIKSINRMLSSLIVKINKNSKKSIILFNIIHGLKVMTTLKCQYKEYIEQKKELYALFSYFDNEFDADVINNFIDSEA